MDEKRRLREEKRELKKSGTRRLRRHLKDPTADPDDFDYGRKRSEVMNTPRPAAKAARERPSAPPPANSAEIPDAIEVSFRTSRDRDATPGPP